MLFLISDNVIVFVEEFRGRVLFSFGCVLRRKADNGNQTHLNAST